ncbi:MAG: TonB-dependent receptor [Bacteroides sp.]|nr:TonB-dependent receptor [Bacteroides sp.]MCM1085647.1 TonB-dependent receptor [Bacteroides sp.]
MNHCFRHRFREILRILICVAVLCAHGRIYAQTAYLLSGRIQDKKTSQTMPDAAIWVEPAGKGTTSDIDGRYQLRLPPGTYTVKVSSLGYGTITRSIEVKSKNLTENFYLEADAVQLEGVEIRGSRAQQAARNTIGMNTFTSEMVQRIPALLGEADIIKAVQMLPGVLMASESSSGFSVRGGGLDQNAILLDRTLIYNPTHTCGFFSVFNNDVIGGAEIYKGDIPIAYGGRLSSVVDVSMRDGNFNDYHLEGGVGLLLAKLTVDGPIWKDHTSFLVSGRTTYFDMFLPLVGMKGTKLGFYDLNARIVHKFDNNKDKISLSGYMGRDRFGMRSDGDTKTGLNFGNKMLALTYTHLFSNRLALNTTVNVSDYISDVAMVADGYDFSWKSRITDVGGQIDGVFTPENHDLRFGFQIKYHTCQPGEMKLHMSESMGFLDSARRMTFNQDKMHSLESALYAGNSQTIGKHLSIKYGLRFSTFSNQGKDSVSRFDKDYQRIDRVYEGERDFYHTWYGFEPRVGIAWLFRHNISLKFNYTRTVQYLQLATNSNSGNPMDIWFPANPFVRPQTADMLALGLSADWGKDGQWSASVEGYYKFMHHVIDFKDHSNVLLNSDLYGELRMGRGWAYGVEVYVQRKKGMVYGSLSYTYSRSMRVIDQVNDGKPYPSPQDRPHAVNLLLNIDPHPRHSLSFNWVFYSGQPATYPVGKAVIDGQFVPVYGRRNSDRFEDYHRLDVSYTFKSKPNTGKRFSWSLSAGLYNAYARKNPWTVSFKQDRDNPNIAYAEKIYLFSAVPFVSFNFKW